MNILMVTMSLGIGGVETHITELTKELIRRGHRVTVASAGRCLCSGDHRLRAHRTSPFRLPVDRRSDLRRRTSGFAAS